MNTLYLLRHAKSSWEDPAIGDHERSLNARGRADAMQLAKMVATLEDKPELVLCSTAQRTRQTLKLVLDGVSVSTIDFREELYLASAQKLMSQIRGIDDARRVVMLVGHNDGLHNLACLLAGSGTTQALQRLTEKLPTCGFVQLAFDAAKWADILPGSGRLIRFITPRFAED